MPRSRDVELGERNGRIRSRRHDSGGSDSCRHPTAPDKRHRKRAKSKSFGKKKKKSSRDKSVENVRSIASSTKPLVEYSDVSSEDLSGPEAGEIQSEDSRGNSFTEGDAPDSFLQRRYYGSSQPPTAAAATAAHMSPITSSPSPAALPLPEPLMGEDFGQDDSRKYAKRKEKKHKRDRKKKRSQSPSSSIGKKKKRKSRRPSPSPPRLVCEVMMPEQSWDELPLKDDTSPISPATPQDRRSLSDMDLGSPPEASPPQEVALLANLRNLESPHTPLLPPKALSPERAKVMSPEVKHLASPPRKGGSPGHVRRRPQSPSPPIMRRREHSPARKREYSPMAMLTRARHSPSPGLRRREFSPSPGVTRRRSGDNSPLSKRRRDESSRRHRRHDKGRDKRKSGNRSPGGARYVFYCLF